MGSCEDTCVFANRPNRKQTERNIGFLPLMFYDPVEMRIQSVCDDEHVPDCFSLL